MTTFVNKSRPKNTKAWYKKLRPCIRLSIHWSKPMTMFHTLQTASGNSSDIIFWELLSINALQRAIFLGLLGTNSLTKFPNHLLIKQLHRQFMSTFGINQLALSSRSISQLKPYNLVSKSFLKLHPGNQILTKVKDLF